MKLLIVRHGIAEAPAEVARPARALTNDSGRAVTRESARAVTRESARAVTRESARAVTRESAAAISPDAERALTPEGRRKMKRGAAGLARFVERLDILASSPLRRARESADILQATLGATERVTLTELEPLADPRDAVDWLAGLGAVGGVVALVGHEPHLGRLATLLLCGRDASRFELRKGAAAMLRFGAAPAAGGARIEWLVQPAQLRRMR